MTLRTMSRTERDAEFASAPSQTGNDVLSVDLDEGDSITVRHRGVRRTRETGNEVLTDVELDSLAQETMQADPELAALAKSNWPEAYKRATQAVVLAATSVGVTSLVVVPSEDAVR